MLRILYTAAIILFAPFICWGATETFYLKHGGDGSAPETLAGAFDEADFNNTANWDTDDQDDGKIGPNDRVEIMDDGGAIRAQLVVRQSGTSGKPITIAAQKGDTPVIKGSEVMSGFDPTTIDLDIELITNGDMELASNWEDHELPTTNERSSTRAYAGTYSRRVVTDDGNEGARTTPGFSVTSGITYYVSGWYYIESGSMRMVRHSGNLDFDSG